MNIMQLLAVSDGGIDPKYLLGVRVETRIPDSVWANYETAKQLWAAEGLDADLFPAPMKATEIAMNACRSVETRRGGDSDKVIEIAVDRVANTKDEVEYRITRKVRDRGSRDIKFHAAMNINFNAAKFAGGVDAWTVTPHEAEHYTQLREAEQKIRDVFTSRLGCIPSSKIRTAVREYLTDKGRMGGVNLTRNTTSSYFVLKEHVPLVDSLERVVTTLYNGDADFDIYPMLDSKGTRALVAKHHDFTSNDEAAKLLADVSEYVQGLDKGTKPRIDALTGLADRARALSEHNEKLRDKLGQEAKRSDAALMLIQSQLTQLMKAKGVAA